VPSEFGWIGIQITDNYLEYDCSRDFGVLEPCIIELRDSRSLQRRSHPTSMTCYHVYRSEDARGSVSIVERVARRGELASDSSEVGDDRISMLEMAGKGLGLLDVDRLPQKQDFDHRLFWGERY